MQYWEHQNNKKLSRLFKARIVNGFDLKFHMAGGAEGLHIF